MTFKEQIETDFDSVLMNTGEFGRVCTWNGQPLKIVESAVLDNEAREAEGVNVQRKKIVCKQSDLQPPPAPTEEITLDGETWYIYDVEKPFVHLIIILQRRIA